MSLVIPDYLKQRFDITLHQQQIEALDAVEGPVLLLAVPGAGKTTVMVARIAHMIANCGIRPDQILTITFSKAGAADMKQRYETLFSPLGWSTPQFSTIHAFCYRVLRSYCRLTGGQIPDLLESQSGMKGRSAVLRDLYSKINREFLAEDVEEELVSNLSLIKNSMLSKDEVCELETDIPRLWELYEAYGSYKRSHNLMDFDDMLGYAFTALRKYPQLCDSYRKKYPFLCVDEAQDTSRLQHEIIRLVAAPQNNLFMVGDEDQSIYRFRGADPQTLMDFPRLYPGARILKMEENFRSSRNIVERAAVFIAQNKNRYEKNMISHAPAGVPIETPKLHDMSEEYQLVLDTVRQQNGTCAVIYRNNFSAIPLVDLLDRKGIPFYIRDHRAAIRNHYVVSDVLAFLALSFDPSDLRAFSRVFHKTSAYIKRNLLHSMDTSPLAAGESWFDRILEQQSDASSSGRAHYISAMIASLRTMKPQKAIETILGPIGYLDFLQYTCGSSFSNQAHKLSALQQLAARVNTVEAFLDRIDGMDQIIRDHSQQNSSSLTLTTAHASKGLEFDTVILLDAVDDIFPGHTAVEDEKRGNTDSMEEEARLFYVACTRARQRLIIPQSDFSGDAPITPSRFISRLVQDPLNAAISGTKGIFPGMRLCHSSFGEGQVMSIDRERGRFVCFFKEKGTRTLTLDVLSSGKIKPL